MSHLRFPSVLQLNPQMGTLHPCLTSPVLWALLIYSSTHVPVLWCCWKVTSAGPIAGVLGCQFWASLRACGQERFSRRNPAVMQSLPLSQTDGQGIGWRLQQGRDGTLPKTARERYSQLRKKGRQDWTLSLSHFLRKLRSSESWILHSCSKSNFPGLSGLLRQNYQGDLK